MRVYYKTTYVERGPQLPIQLISIGMIREDGQSLYLINADCLSNVARHPWLSVNVFPHLPAKGAVNAILEWDTEHEDFPRVMTFDVIGPRVLDFLREVDDVELWGYYSDFDHVVLTQLFGSRADYPAGIPMYTRDLMQTWDELGQPDIKPYVHYDHHALMEAVWIRTFDEHIRDEVQPTITEEIES